MDAQKISHEVALALVAEHCPQQAGLLWNTTNHTACDTAHAVADQYECDEIDQAVSDLQKLAAGETPEAWELFCPAS